MAKNIKRQEKEISAEPDLSPALVNRLQKLSVQTGLSLNDLVYKWILQEETLVALTQLSKENSIGRERSKIAKKTLQPEKTSAEHSDAQEPRAQAALTDPLQKADFRAVLAQRVESLKKAGMPVKRIADLFNEEKVPTLRGKGQWYPSSISLLSSKKEGQNKTGSRRRSTKRDS